MPKAASHPRWERPPEPGVLPARVFSEVRQLMYDQAGIELRPGKEALVSARLSKRMRETGCRSYEAFVEGVRRDATGEGLLDLIDALTTNFTSFLREPAHFEFLRERAAREFQSRAHVDLWCAAAATGEEAYSIAFTLADVLGFDRQGAARCRVLATDISRRALARARRGIYPAERFSGVPRGWLRKYLLQGTGESAGLYRVRPEIARAVEFRRVNLVEPAAARLAPASGFPLIWCRNVMIYFDAATQQRVVAALEQNLEPGGYLFVGHSESLSGIRHGLEYVQPAVYRRPR